MAKTNFYDGQWLTSPFMQTFFGTNAATGHVHTGLDADGSAPKIDLANHTTGIVPIGSIPVNIDHTVSSGTFDATFMYDGISIPFSYTLYQDDRVVISWPKGSDMTGGATSHNAIGFPVPAEIRPDGTNVYQYCPGFAWDYVSNTHGLCHVGIVSNGQMFIGQNPSLTSNKIRVERGTCVYYL